MKLDKLETGQWIMYRTSMMQSQYAQVIGLTTDMNTGELKARVKAMNGYIGVITHNDDWCEVDSPYGDDLDNFLEQSDIQQKKRKEAGLAGIRIINDFTMKDVEPELDDIVNEPSHYTYGDVEVIDYVEQVTATYPPELAFAVGNAIKYLSRAPHKNGKQDIEKAQYYVNRIFEKWEDK